MLSRYTPWFAGDDIYRSLVPLFDLAFSPPFDLAAPVMEAGPKVDILEKDGGIELVCDVPGARPEDVHVTMENGVLTIQAHRAPDYPNAAVRRAERYHGTFVRSFRLGGGYDPDQVSATLQHGVLVVHVAKRPEAKPRKIPVYLGAEAENKQLGATSDTTPASA